MSTIKLESSDGVVFPVDLKVAKMIGPIQEMIENLGTPEEGEVIPVPIVKAATLKNIVTWASYHSKNDPPPEAVAVGEGQDGTNLERRTDDISPWGAEFLKNMDKEALFQLVLAANYLNMKGLLDITTKAVANMITGKTPQEIRDTFDVTNDFTKSEEVEVQTVKENE